SSSIKSSTTSSAGIGWTRVVLGAHVREISDALRLDDETVIVNPRWKDGQLSSIQAAIEGLSRLPTDGLLLFLVDHPLVSAGLLKKLVEVFYAAPVCRIVGCAREPRRARGSLGPCGGSAGSSHGRRRRSAEPERSRGA